MPKMPPTHDPQGRTPAERRRERNARHDRKRAREKEYRAWYQTPQWKALRASHIALEPSCRMCRGRGQIVAATTVDHIKEHNGDAFLFFDPGNLQSLCTTDHNSAKQRLEAARRRPPLPTRGRQGD